MYGAWKLGQSLGDVARDSRERKKATATKVITDEDLEPKKPGSTSGLDKELDRMRKILLAICDDPKTEHGRNLSDYDKKTITDGVKPLRSAWPSTRASRKNTRTIWLKWRRITRRSFRRHFHTTGQPDIDRVKALRLEYEGKKQNLVNRGELDLKDYGAFQKQLESVGEECPLAAKTVPD
jgi:hypothetical protein